MQTALASSERIFKLLDNQDEIPEAPGARARRLPARRSAWRGSSFAYEAGGRQVVRGPVRGHPQGPAGGGGGPHRGRQVAPSSTCSCASTTWREGRITVDGVDLRGTGLSRSCASLFGLVLQDVFIFSGTLEENIVLGRPLDAGAAGLGAGAEPARGPGGAAAPGPGDPGGRAGPEALAPASASWWPSPGCSTWSPQILLLDEATANIDSETEHKIQKVIERVSHRLTTFTIAHRLSTIKDADEIWVMDQGQLVERGSHDGLMARDGDLRQAGAAAVRGGGGGVLRAHPDPCLKY